MKIPLQAEPSTMEMLVRWDCSCTTPRWACPECGGEGLIDAWLTPEDVAVLDKPYTVLSSERIKKAA
jgi:hypothetical protein